MPIRDIQYLNLDGVIPNLILNVDTADAIPIGHFYELH
jgi:hypothetical protein